MLGLLRVPLCPGPVHGGTGVGQRQEPGDRLCPGSLLCKQAPEKSAVADTSPTDSRARRGVNSVLARCKER